jgi:anti-anti-sigma regulatory factor
MDITVSQARGRVPISVVRLDGKLDSQTCGDLIARARELYESGTRDVLIDLSGLAYIGSAGLVALHTIALLLCGTPLPDPGQSWKSVKSIDRGDSAGARKHTKLLNPQPEVSGVLDMVGFSKIFEIFNDRQKAIQAFG